jgi:hypothetical protein
MDGRLQPQDHELMKLNPLHARQERKARELVELEAFRTVRRVAEQELREMASTSPGSPEVAAAQAAVDAAMTAEDVVAAEPLVRRAGSVLGIDVPEDRTVRVAERWVSWADVGASYAGVVTAARASELGASPEQRDLDLRAAQRRDRTRGEGYSGAGGSGAG